MKNVSDFSLRQKAASVATAFVLMATPIVAHAEKGDSDTSTPFKLVQQEKKMVGSNLTVEAFTLLVERAYNYAKKFFNYPNMQQDIQNVCYLLNRGYMSKEEGTEEKLIQMGVVTPIDIENGIFDSIISVQSFGNVRADYNQSMIRETNDPSKLFNMAAFCCDESDRELYNTMFNLWVNTHLGNSFSGNDVVELFKVLTTLNGMEGIRNVDDMNAGAKFEGLYTFGLDLMQVLQDFLLDNYSKETELSKYYDLSLLVKDQWSRNNHPTEQCANVTIPEEVLQGGNSKVIEFLVNQVVQNKRKPLDSTIIGYRELLLSLLVDIHTEVEYFALETSLNDLIRSFDKTCSSNIMTKPILKVLASNKFDNRAQKSEYLKAMAKAAYDGESKGMVKSILPNMYQRSLRG